MAALIPELYVSDLDVSLAFYAALGFGICYRREEERFARIAREGAELMLGQPRGRTWLLAPLQSSRGLGMNLQITVEAVDALFADLPAGARVLLAPESRTYRRLTDWITVRQCVLADPDGYLLRFSQVLAIKPAPPPATP